ncbi:MULTISPECIES: GFA family protein [Bradyrhizobium]|uniref:GFA family protein n=1 Tax=Bradyrhizobium TaxID=374 RepID=UPI001EDB24B0
MSLAITKHCPASNPLLRGTFRLTNARGQQQQETSMPTYRGACHCGAVTFRLMSDIAEPATCDCSLCRQRNALMTKAHEGALKMLGGGELLSVYEWNTHRAKHFFCSRCSIDTFHRKRAAPDHFGFNVFCLEDFDPASVAVRATEGIGMSAMDPNARTQWPGPREVGWRGTV